MLNFITPNADFGSIQLTQVMGHGILTDEFFLSAVPLNYHKMFLLLD